MSTLPITACPCCSSQVPMGSRFCGECGQSFVAGPAPTANGPAARPNFPPRPASAARSESMTYVALGMALLGILMCGPFTSVPGIFLAMREASAAKAVGAPTGLASLALWGNVAATILGLLGMAAAALFFMLALAAGV